VTCEGKAALPVLDNAINVTDVNGPRQRDCHGATIMQAGRERTQDVSFRPRRIHTRARGRVERRPHEVSGAYQSPILIQRHKAPRQQRQVEITLPQIFLDLKYSGRTDDV
jgi:hypothetical protein